MPTVNYAWSSVNGSFDFNSNYTTGSQDYAAVTSVNGGSKYFGVFFTPDGIVGRFFDNLGNALGGDFQVNLTFSGVQTDASVTQLTNGNITSLNMCELGGNGCEGKCLTSTDLKFLQKVHQALGELFKQIEEENKANGYSFPTKLDDE